MHYLDFSEKHDTQPVNAASFGKVGLKNLVMSLTAHHSNTHLVLLKTIFKYPHITICSEGFSIKKIKQNEHDDFSQLSMDLHTFINAL